MSFHSLVHWRSGFPTPPTCPARLKTLCLAMALISAGASGLAIANPALPQGGSVTSGSGSISQSGPDMTVQTTTPRTVIDWHSFNVGPNNSISFRQPDGTSVTLNRVLGGDPSKIYGTITSNGQLILVNPAGVWFGPKSRISANALVASAGFVTEEQAKEFARTGKLDIQLKGLVRNEGHITVHDNGMVALLGAQVENAGVIQAKKGTAKLASGPQATLDFQGDGLINLAVGGEPGDKGSVNGDVTGGVHNSGQIDVGNGVIAMSADRAAKHLDSVINIGGDLVADSVSSEGGTIVLGNAATTNVNGNLSAKGTSGGQIKVLGDEVNVAGTAKIDASGTQGAGGKVLVGGSYQGKGPEPASKATTVAKGAQLKADGKTDGGQIVIWSDGKTHFSGSASATGQRKGGEVETSGKQLTVTSDAKVNTRGRQANGTWLLDPAEVNIDATDAGGSVAASTIVSGLANGNVVIRATDTLNVNAPIIATNLATVDNDGRTSPSTLALISAGNAGVISTFEGTDKRNASGAVNIKAPILLKDGNLYISATGDIRLIDNAQSGETGDAAFGKRAIIDVGSGVAWLKTSDTASIFQDSNTAIIANQLAVEGASVHLDSALNHAGTLAGKASNGVFSYNQTNASGQAPSLDKAVIAPLTGETLSGVKAYALTNVGTQEIIANGQPYRDIELKPSSGSTFDYVVFEAVDLRDEHGNEIPKADLLRYLDSSDYLVNGLAFKDTAGHSWQFLPDSSKPGLTRVLRDGVEVDAPVGFALNGVGGLAMSGVFLDKAFWGVSGEYIPGASNQFEIQYNAQTGSSQQLVFKLGNSTESVLAQIGWLLDDKPWIQTSDGKPATQAQLNETARIQFLASQDKTDSNISLNSNKAIISATPQNVQREYGDANPGLNQTIASNAAADVVRGVDRYVDAQLGRGGVTQGTPSTSATQQSNVGDYAINGSLAGDTYAQQRYDLQKNTGTLKVTPAELTVTAKDKSKVYGDTDPALDYSVSGGKLGQTGDQLLNGGDLARQPGENVGNYAISQGELGLNNGLGGNYRLTFVDGKLQITPATLVVSADDKQKTYGDSDPALSYQVSGLKRGDTQGEVLNSGSLNRDTGENVGRYGIQQGSVDLNSGKGANYILQFNDGVFSIVPAELTVTADGKAKVYGDADPALSYKVDGLKRGDSAGQVLNDGGLVRQAGEDVGHYGIQQGSLDLNATGGQNYILHYVDGDFVITPATLTVTADGKTKVYGDLDPSLSYQVAGLKNGDLQTDVLNPGKVKRDQGENVGDYAIRQGDVALAGSKAQNYVLSFVDGTFSITPATLTVSADSHTKVYGDLDPNLTYKVSGLKNGDSQGDVLNAGGLQRDQGENVGNYGVHQGTVGLNNGQGSNYVLSFVDGNLAITPATLTITAQDKSKVYGNADPGLTHVVSGLKNGDTAASVLNSGSLSRDAGENVGRYGIQQGSVDLNSGKGANYILQFNDGVFSIVPAELTVTADGKAKVYGDTDPALSYKVDGLKRGDSAGQVLNDGGLVRQAGEDVGHYGIQQGSLDLNASGGQNYILRYVDGDFVITPATLTVTADGKTKVYGDLDPSLSYQVAGLKNGDLQTDVLNPGKVKRDQGENVGDYAIRQGDVALAGSKAQNYVLSFVDGTFSITPATLTVSADSHTKVYGDLDPNLTYKVSGLKNGDSQGDVLNPGALQRDQGENVGNYGIHQGTVGLNNGQGSNYVLSFVDGNLAITPATLTITAQDKSKVYGDADPALTHVVSGLKNGETAASVLNGGSLHREAGENVKPGGYAIGQGSLGLNAGAGSNYNMVFKDGTLQITPAPLVVSADDKSKVQGAADPTLSWQVSGLKNGDTADIAKGSLTRAPGEDPGAYGISQGKAFDAGSNYTVTFRDGTLTITGPLVPVDPQPPIDPENPVTPPATTPPLGLPLGAQSPGNTRCTALESPSAVSANYTVSPAVARTYAVQLICKPRSYGDKTSTTPDITDVLTYANGLFKDGKLVLPDWNRSVIPHDLTRDTKGGK